VRVTRVVTLVATVAAAFLGATAVPGNMAAADHLQAYYTPLAVTLVFGGMLALFILTFVLDLRRIRFAQGTYALVFLALQFLWVAALTSPLPDGVNPWILELGALGTVPAAIAWRPWAAWTYLGVLSVIVGPIRFITNGGVDWTVPLQNLLLTPTLAALFTALAMVAVRNAEAVDEATRELRDATARSAAARARAQEEIRLDALVHDEVMSTLFYASRGDARLDESVRAQARDALAGLERLRGGRSEPAAGVSPDGFVTRLRAVVLGASIDVGFDARVSRTTPLPGDVASAFAEATGEAVRNSLQHAGERANRRVTVVVEENGIEVRIYDTGVGFDVREVPPHRLGILVSIRGRLATIPDGRAHVTSYPGAGTLVTLEWTST
jgi:hypothetical protein